MIRVPVLTKRRLDNENTLLFIRPITSDYPDDICCVESDTVIAENPEYARLVGIATPPKYIDVTHIAGTPSSADTWRDGCRIFREKYGHLPNKEGDKILDNIYDMLTRHYQEKIPMSEFCLS